MKVEICEYNPEAGRARYENEPVCGNPAVLTVGSKGQWHLCESCAALPAFKRLTKRTKLSQHEQTRQLAAK